MRLSLRTRLTLIFAGLFLASGLVLLGLTYVLVDARVPGKVAVFGHASTLDTLIQGNAAGGLAIDEQPFLKTIDGRTISAEEAPAFIEQQQARVRDDTMGMLLPAGVIALLVVGVAAAGIGWLVAGRVLAPLHAVTETARRIATSRDPQLGLRERIALDGPPDEVKELADTFDTMVERLDRSFEGQRRFVANASHELRTPLTLNRALVEVAMHRRTASADVKQLGETLLEINTRHERLINGLLLLARSDTPVLDRTEVDLADVVSHVCATAATEAREAGVELTRSPGEAVTHGDPVLIERLAQNLVENAIRHNLPAGGFARVTSRHGGDGRVVLEVVNSGPVIPPYDIPGLFEPFRRLGAERLVTAKGVGLGLSIVRSVARAHDGDVVATPRDGGGLIVTVTLPA
ncbi:HAMP domain-containing sensor histidine kinase [Luedemannella flava]|uniref:histidine kinase n=1 Tax=Luedemannella flava TaxID=349316 RepID=A0ABP4YTM9_9ACTN